MRNSLALWTYKKKPTYAIEEGEDSRMGIYMFKLVEEENS